MSKLAISTNVMAPADLLWQVIGRFGAIGEWHPMAKGGVTSGSDRGATRRIDLPGGGSVVERLDYVSDKERIHIYSITDSPLPVTDYVAEIRVRDRGDGTSSVEWSCNFTPAGGKEHEAVKTIQAMYQTGLDNLQKIFTPRK